MKMGESGDSAFRHREAAGTQEDSHGSLAPQRCAERNRRRRLLARSSAHCLGMTGVASLRTSAADHTLSLRTSSQTGVAISDAEQRISWHKKIPTAVCALPRNDESIVLANQCARWCGNLAPAGRFSLPTGGLSSAARLGSLCHGTTISGPH